MTGHYYVDWLDARRARRLAAIERRVYPRDYRAGRRDIAEQLAVADAAGQNLSIGLYHGTRLVGYLLAFVELARADICNYLQCTPPAGLVLDGPGIYIADLAVLDGHRRGVAKLFSRLMAAGYDRSELRGLPVDAFCRDDQLHNWTARVRLLAHVGFRHTGTYRFYYPPLGQDLHWLSFDQQPPPEPNLQGLSLEEALRGRCDAVLDGRPVTVGHLDSVPGWSLLTPWWERLATQTAGATVCQSLAYQRLWWSQLGLSCDPFIVVVLAEDEPLAIAPLQIYPAPWLGKVYRSLGFIVHPWESDRPRLLTGRTDPALAELVVDYLFAERAHWDAAYLHEQSAEDPLFIAWRRRLEQEGFVTSRFLGAGAPVIDTAGGWQTYLAQRSPKLRKSARNKLSRLRRAGRLELRSIDRIDEIETAIAMYMEVESHSWKHGTEVGVGKTSAHRAFYLELVRRLAAQGGVQFRFLMLDGQPIAGTLGLYWNDVLYSLHVTHDEAHARLSPGFVLTWLELEQVFALPRCRGYDLLGGFLANKRGWATAILPTVSLYAHVPDARGRLFHLLHFRLKPRLRRLLARLGLLEPWLRLKCRLQGRQRRELVDS